MNGSLKQFFTKPLLVFIFLGITFGTLFTLLNPPGFGLDERGHYLRVFEISHGKLFATTIGQDNHPGAGIPENLASFVDTSTGQLSTAIASPSAGIFLKKYANFPQLFTFFGKGTSGNLVDDYVSNDQLKGTFSYNFIAYLPMVLGEKIAETLRLPLLANFYLVRLFALIVYLTIVYYSIKLTPARYKWLLLIIALLPTSLYQAATVSIDGLVNSMTFLLFSQFTLSIHNEGRVDRRSAIIVLIILTVLAVTKVPYILLGIPFLFLSVEGVDMGRTKLLKTFCASFVVGAVFIWQLFTRHNTTRQVLASSVTVDPIAQISNILHHPLSFIATLGRTTYVYSDRWFGELTSKLGNVSIGPPLLIGFLFLAVLVYFATKLTDATETYFDENGRRVRRILAWALLLTVLAIMLSLYLVYCQVGAKIIDGIQGRYFLPILPFSLLLFTLDIGNFGNKKDTEKRLVLTLTTFLTLTALVLGLANL